MIEQLIRKLERYAPLSAAERATLQALPVKLREYSRGDVIVQQGSTPNESVLLMAGITFRYKMLKGGSRQIVAVQVPGDFVDLHCFVLKPIDHEIAAGSPVRVGRVPHSAIEAILEKHPRLVRALMWDMAVDGAISREWLAAQGRRSAYEQLAHFFCELYFRMRWAGLVKDGSFELSMTQAELGDACGLSTVHVNRSIQALRKDALIILEDHILTIPDIAALTQVANFDPAYLHILE